MAEKNRGTELQTSREHTGGTKPNTRQAPEAFRRLQREYRFCSQQQVLAEIIDCLAKSDPDIAKIVEQAREAQRHAGQKLAAEYSRRGPYPPRDDYETVWDQILDTLYSQVQLDPSLLPHAISYGELLVAIDTESVVNVVNENTIQCFLDSRYPQWQLNYDVEGDCWDPEAEEGWCINPPPTEPGDPPGTNWEIQDANHDLARVSFSASAIGPRTSQDEWIGIGAEWLWAFAPQQDGEVEIDVRFFVSGPCSWSQGGGGDVTLGVLAGVGYDDVAAEESLCVRYHSSSTILGPDGRPPQGYFGGNADGSVLVIPAYPYPRMSVSAGHAYGVNALASVHLMANLASDIMVGDLSASGSRDCQITGTCRIWKCP